MQTLGKTSQDIAFIHKSLEKLPRQSKPMISHILRGYPLNPFCDNQGAEK